MVTIGDSFSIVAILVGLGLTSWSMIAIIAFLFPSKVKFAATRVETAPVKALLGGVGMFIVGGIGIGLLSAPSPLGKLVGWILMLGVLMIGVYGAAGLSSLASQRLQTLAGPSLNDYAAFLRGAGFLVTACMFPVLGWFLFTPIVLLISMGAGWSAIRAKASVSMEANKSVFEG